MTTTDQDRALDALALTGNLESRQLPNGDLRVFVIDGPDTGEARAHTGAPDSTASMARAAVTITTDGTVR